MSPPPGDTCQRRGLGQAQEGEAAPHRSTFHRPEGKSVPRKWSDFGPHCSSSCLSQKGSLSDSSVSRGGSQTWFQSCGHASHACPLMLAVFPLRIFLLAPFSMETHPCKSTVAKTSSVPVGVGVPWASLPLSTPVGSELLLPVLCCSSSLTHPSLHTP